MKFIFSIIMALAWAHPVMAGTITFDFKMQGNACVVSNRGDSPAFYPAVFQLGHAGQWTRLKSNLQQAELSVGGMLTAEPIDQATEPERTGIETARAVMIRFFDQTGVSFGHIALLRPPPETRNTVAAGYVGTRLRIAAPPEKSGIHATWVLTPREEGIAPIFGPLPFTYRQPPAVRIEWQQKPTAEIEAGAALPAAILLHESPEGITLQKVPGGRGNRVEQRTAWLNMKIPFCILAIVCGISGVLFSVKASRIGRNGAPL